MSTAKGDRLRYLHKSRELLYSLPCDKLFELPGRPNVLYTIKDYSYDKVKGATDARQEAGFMFKAFETGQIGPRRLARMIGENTPRNATIHEYLDWTVTALEAKDDTEYVSAWECCCCSGHGALLWGEASCCCSCFDRRCCSLTGG